MNNVALSAASLVSARTALSFQAPASDEQSRGIASPLDKVALNPQPLPPKSLITSLSSQFAGVGSYDDDYPFCGTPFPHPPIPNLDVLGGALRFE